jgi:lipopolysaccharide export system permease protein
VLWPGIVLGLLTSGGTLALYHSIIPYTHHLLRSMFINDSEELLYNVLRSQRQINYGQLDYAIFVRGVQGRRLLSPIFKRRDPNRKQITEAVAAAREAELRVDARNKMILVQMKYGEVWSRNGTTAEFVDRLFDVPLPDEVDPGYRRARDMTWQEMDEFTAQYVEKREKYSAAIVRLTPLKTAGVATLVQLNELLSAHHEVKTCNSRIRAIVVERHMRPALALGCLFFVLVGCPVGIWFSRSDYLSSFITCFLPIVFLYYPLILCSTSMAKDNRGLPPEAVWIPDVLMALLGVVLFRRLLRN